jgi:Holliday junction resolvase
MGFTEYDTGLDEAEKWLKSNGYEISNLPKNQLSLEPDIYAFKGNKEIIIEIKTGDNISSFLSSQQMKYLYKWYKKNPQNREIILFVKKELTQIAPILLNQYTRYITY